MNDKYKTYHLSSVQTSGHDSESPLKAKEERFLKLHFDKNRQEVKKIYFKDGAIYIWDN